MVLGAGLYLAISQVGTQQTLVRTTGQQGDHAEQLIAREIARSGFNVAMGIARQHGSDLYEAVQAINGDDGALTGEHQGGEYVVEAYLSDGFTLNIESRGYFGGAWSGDDYEGGAQHLMEDNYQVRVLKSQQCSALNARYLESDAGYCSGIYLQRYPAGATAANLPDPEMVFPVASKDDNVDLTAEFVIPAGTQMDFFIGVDKKCDHRPDSPATYDVTSHEYDEGDYDHIHNAIEFPFENFDYITESDWAFVEQHPADNQKWRIGWEDLHHPEWMGDGSDDPEQNLQALKRLGYEGDAANPWPTRDGFGYRDLEDFWVRDGHSKHDEDDHTAFRPDFSDQVVEVWLDPIPFADQPAACSVGGSPDPDGDDGSGGDDGGSGDPDPDGTTGSGGDDGGDDGSGGDDGEGEPDPCACPKANKPNKKVLIMHFPGDDPKKGRAKCVSVNGAYNGHLKRHDLDYVMCQGE